MTRKHIVSLVAASLILAGTAFAQQSPQEPQAPAGGQPGSMMRPGIGITPGWPAWWVSR